MYYFDAQNLATNNTLISLLSPPLLNGKQAHIEVHEIALSYSGPGNIELSFFFNDSLRNQLILVPKSFQEISDYLFFFRDRPRIIPYGVTLKVSSSNLISGELVQVQMIYKLNYEPTIDELASTYL